MSGNGPVLTRVYPVVDVVTGASYALLAQAVVTDASEPDVTATVQASLGSLDDPDAATDGSDYDSATGVFTVSGTTAEVTAVLEGLLFAPASNAGDDAPGSLSLSVVDGDSQSAQAAIGVEIYTGASFSVGAGQIYLSGSLDAATAGGGSEALSSPQSDVAGGTIAALDGADVTLGFGVVWLSGGDNQVEFDASAGGAWNAAYGDDGAFSLYGASVSVFGDGASVAFSSAETGDAVSFYGPAGGDYAETVVGSDGEIIETDVAVTLTGDDDTIYLESSDDVLDLTAASPGAWSTLYGQGGTVTLAAASLSIVGGGVTVSGGAGDAVSVYQTDGVADIFNGDDASVTLNQAQAIVNGSGDAIWLVAGSGSTVTTNSSASQPDTVYGAGTIEVASGGVASVGGGALIDFQQSGESTTLSYTQGVWDRVQGAAGTTNIFQAQAVVDGGGQIVNFLGGYDSEYRNADDNQLSINDTNGDWDTIYGNGGVLTINSAQASLVGLVDDIYLTGAGAEVSLAGANYSYYENRVHASDASIVVDDSSAQFYGASDKLFATTSQLSLYSTQGNWDAVYGQYNDVSLFGAQASVVGGENTIEFAQADDAASLYATNGMDDQVYSEGFGGSLTLNDAGANAQGGQMTFSFGPGANVLSLSGTYNYDYYESYYGNDDNVLNFTGAFGQDMVYGFNSTDVIQVSHTQFADFQAFQSALTQHDDDYALLTLDADDNVKLYNVAASSITAAQVKIV